MGMDDEPLIVRGKGQPGRSTLEERLQRCDLELKSVLKLDEQMEVYEVDMRNMRSIFLEKNDDFKSLLIRMKDWNEDVRAWKTKKRPIARPAYRYHLMKYLCSNLREVANTRNRQVQLFYLIQLREWFDRQNNIISRPQTQGGRNGSTLTRPVTSSVAAFNQISFFGAGDEIGPTRTDFDDFFGNHRTKYSLLDPPGDRIKEFTTKEFGWAREGNQSANGTRSNTAMNLMNSSRPMTQASGIRPSTQQQSMRILSNAEMSSRGMSRRGMASSQSQFREDKLRPSGILSQASQPWNYTDALSTLQKKSSQFESLKLTRFQECGEFEQSNNYLAQSIQKEEPMVLQPSKKAFRSDINSSYAPEIRPNSDSKSTFINYIPSDEVGEIRLENMWLINRNKAVSDKRENEEIQNHILNWSTNKGIVDQEINRKNELTYYCSNFNKIGKVIEATIPKEILSEKNFIPKQVSAREKEEESQFKNYLNIVKKSRADKHEMAHPSANEDSTFQIAQIADLSLPSPLMEQQQMSRFTEGILDNQEVKRNQLLKQKSFDLDQIKQNQKNLDEVPKTQYISLKDEIRDKNTQEQHPFFEIEAQIKRSKIAKLRQTSGKIIGLSSEKTGDEPDEEDILRRKQQSLQIYHQGGHINKQFRPFSSIYKFISTDNLKAEHLLEIQNVKRSFARSGIKCSINTIQQSLSIPQGLPKSSLQLPIPGSMLFTNPFVTFGKKTSSKKKKK